MILSDLVHPEDLNAALTLGLVSARTSDDGALTFELDSPAGRVVVGPVAS